MKLIIDIPTEFETDYEVNRFQDFFTRVLYSIEKVDGLYGLCGNYEKETAEMFLKAFDESVPMDNIVENIEKHLEEDSHNEYSSYYRGNYQMISVYDAINIVKQKMGVMNNEPTNN